MDIIPFWRAKNKWGEFSNWYIHPRAFDEYQNGRIYFICVEQEMMYRKAETFQDLDVMEKIEHTFDPRKLKELGRQVKNYNDDIWNRIRYAVVFQACLKKFSFFEDLGDLLISTGDSILVEASPYDATWGIGMGTDTPGWDDQTRWGKNLLGKVLMDVRTVLKNA